MKPDPLIDKELEEVVSRLTKLGVRWVDTDNSAWNLSNNIDAEECIREALISYATYKVEEARRETLNEVWSALEPKAKSQVYGFEINETLETIQTLYPVPTKPDKLEEEVKNAAILAKVDEQVGRAVKRLGER